MKKKATKKLQLKAESIRNLTRDLDKVRGGVWVTPPRSLPPPTGRVCPV